MKQYLITREEAQEVGSILYTSHLPCNKNHIPLRYTSNRGCYMCTLLRSRSEESLIQKREYYAKNREKFKEYSRGTSAQKAQYYLDNKVYITKRNNEWRNANRERVNERARMRFQENPKSKIERLARDSLKRVLLITGDVKQSRSFDALGYTKEELITSIQSKFSEGMSWENYSYNGWHIDHKNSIKYLADSGETDPSIINSLDNLIPMWAEDNLSKGSSNLKEWLDSLGPTSRQAELYSKFL